MFLVDYADLLEKQCEFALKSILGEKASGSEYVFSEICKRLTKDFLPPVEREDIASLSYALFDISKKCDGYALARKGRECDGIIRKQIEFLPAITNGILKKKKTCGDDIRRFININSECEKTVDGDAAKLNAALADFIKTAYSAFFKNL